MNVCVTCVNIFLLFIRYSLNFFLFSVLMKFINGSIAYYIYLHKYGFAEKCGFNIYNKKLYMIYSSLVYIIVLDTLRVFRLFFIVYIFIQSACYCFLLFFYFISYTFWL